MAFARDLAHIVDGFLPRVPLADLGRQAADLPGQDLLDVVLAH
jgi:hypothetical protein